ncbi:GNAT family N-acetyltransferase [Rhizobium helianthi]|uniref:GNAT family N-acetyltransferase n=1 Tax=Rhizobium helianthi TaxID=1132695 RepID=A0ABW4LZP9_9HYPH
MALRVRAATASDEVRFLELWAAYLAFYQASVSPDITRRTWARALDPKSAIFMRVAEVDGRMEGFALCLTHEGTWTLGKHCYLEDLFVDASQRGKGVGRALVRDLVDLANQNGWSRLYWHTAESNATARALYDSFVQSDGYVRYRIQFG